MIRFNRLHRLRDLAGVLAIVMALIGSARMTQAQATATAAGPGHRWLVGGTFSYYAAQWGERNLGGESAFVDYARSSRINYEAEVRFLNLNEEPWTQAHQSTYLGGVKFPYHRKNLTFYGKFLVGDGHFNYSYNYGTGNYFVIAPGGGVDLSLGHSRYSIRLADFEYQDWVNFYWGMLHPYGVSTGFAVHFR
jgi:hypothetical protein